MPLSPDEQFVAVSHVLVSDINIGYEDIVNTQALSLIWKFDFSPFMVLTIAILNDGTIMTISKDKVKSSSMPDSWKLKEIFTTEIVLDTYLAFMTVAFFWVANYSDFFLDKL
ncbi:hypothetical protein GOBAR_DD16200 [Gossypium barbadense]|nr:hypothetical protein GOBAR_DD16200 [Gossypium barbadense]